MKFATALLSFVLCAGSLAQAPAAKPVHLGTDTPAASASTPPPLTEALKKEFADTISSVNIDQVDLENKQKTVLQTDSTAQKAQRIMMERVNSDPEVQKALKAVNDDIKALQDKVVELRKKYKLDSSWDINTQTLQWFKTAPPAEKK